MLFILNKNLSVVWRFSAVNVIFAEQLVLLFLCKSLHCYAPKLRGIQLM